jgi:hypothetical protein
VQSVRARTVHRHANGAARSGSIKTSSRPLHRLPASKSAETNDRMRITAGETVPSCSDNSTCGTPANTDASATGPSLPVVDERYAARSTKVRSSTNRTRMRASTEPEGRAGWSERDAALSRSYLTEGGFRQALQAAPKVSLSEAVGGEGVCRDFQAARVPCHLVPASHGPARHIDARRSTSPAVTARRPPAGKSAQVHRDAPLPPNHQDQSGHKVGTDFGATSRRVNLRS